MLAQLHHLMKILILPTWSPNQEVAYQHFGVELRSSKNRGALARYVQVYP